MRRSRRVLLISTIVGLIGVGPFFLYRAVYAHAKRLREIEPGRVYRCGQLTAEGFTDAVRTYKIRTVLNLQEDNLDPSLARSYLNTGTIHESKLCEKLQVRFKVIAPDLIYPRAADQGARPEAVDEFLRIMDDPETYPVLFHCKAGLHRTGIMAAIYRMEYHGWSVREAFEELREHGFGDRNCTAANEYVRQYVLNYRPGQRRPLGQANAGK
jgi:protein-tyrosine phosphatase